jgi:hypothetical protein
MTGDFAERNTQSMYTQTSDTRYEQTVLADSYEQSLKGLKPRINTFSAKDGEDFRQFKKLLENYFHLTNITSQGRKLTILNSLLYGEAETFMEDWLEISDPVSYEGAIKALQDQYVTSELLQAYELAYYDISQDSDEKPQTFYARLRSAAKLAENPDPSVLLTRFRTGLLPPIRAHCLAFGATTIAEWKKHADDWWMGYRSSNTEKNQSPKNAQMKNKPYKTPMVQTSSLNMMDIDELDEGEGNQSSFIEKLAKMVALQINQTSNEGPNDDKKQKKASKIQNSDDINDLKETIRQVVRQEMNQGYGNNQNRYRNTNYNRYHDQNNGYRQNDYRRQEYQPRENDNRNNNYQNQPRSENQSSQQPAKNYNSQL